MYESYLKKDGENREVNMAEIGIGKHVIAGYVGSGGQVRRIPALGRIDHFKIAITGIKAYSIDGVKKIDISDSISLERRDISDYPIEMFIYSDSSQSTRIAYFYGGISGSQIYISLFAEIPFYEIELSIQIYAVYADGCEISLQIINNIIESKFSAPFYFNVPSSAPTQASQFTNSVYFSSGDIVFQLAYNGSIDLPYRDYKEVEFMDGIFIVSTSITASNSGGNYGTTSLTIRFYSSYDGITCTDQDGNYIPFSALSWPDSWGGVKYIFTIFVWGCMCHGI